MRFWVLTAIVNAIVLAHAVYAELPGKCSVYRHVILTCQDVGAEDFHAIEELLRADHNFVYLYLLNPALRCDCQWELFLESVEDSIRLLVSGHIPCGRRDMLDMGCGVKENQHYFNQDDHHEMLLQDPRNEHHLEHDFRKPNEEKLMDGWLEYKKSNVALKGTHLLHLKDIMQTLSKLRNEMTVLLDEDDQKFLLHLFHLILSNDLRVLAEDGKEGKNMFEKTFHRDDNHPNIVHKKHHRRKRHQLQVKLLIFGSVVGVVVSLIVIALLTRLYSDKDPGNKASLSGDLDLDRYGKRSNWSQFLDKLQTNARQKALQREKRASINYEPLRSEFSPATKVQYRADSCGNEDLNYPDSNYVNVTPTKHVTFNDKKGDSIIGTLEELEFEGRKPGSVRYDTAASPCYQNVKGRCQTPYRIPPCKNELRLEVRKDDQEGNGNALCYCKPHKNKTYGSTEASSGETPILPSQELSCDSSDFSPIVKLELRPRPQPRDRSLSRDRTSQFDSAKRGNNSDNVGQVDSFTLSTRKRDRSTSPLKNLIDRFEDSHLTSTPTSPDASPRKLPDSLRDPGKENTDKQEYAKLARECYKKEKRRLSFSSDDTQDSIKKVMHESARKLRPSSRGRKHNESSSSED